MHGLNDCYHGRLGVSLAEQRLRCFGKEGGFLTRESNIKQGFFVLSVFVKGDIVHRVALNKYGLIKKQSFDEASVVLNDLIQSSQVISKESGRKSSDPVQ